MKSRANMKSALKHNKALAAFALCLVLVHGISYAYGVLPWVFWWTWVIVLPLTLLSYALALTCLIVGILALAKRQSVLRYGAVWILLSAVLLIPGYYSEFAGALTSFYAAGPRQVFAEARSLIAKCQQSRQNCGDVVDLPPAIQRVHPVNVYVSNGGFVVIGKLGLVYPDGFMIFSQGSLPSEGMRVKKIGEELYWTYGN